MNKILATRIDQLARDIPGATAVFSEFGLELFCGGEHSLMAIADEQGLDGKIIAKQLSALKDSGNLNKNWLERSASDLIEHILFCYHEQYRQHIPQLIRLAKRVELDHGNQPECPLGLAFLLSELEPVLNTHMRKEKEKLFPMLLQEGKEGIKNSIDAMMSEHKMLGETLFQLNQLTNNITAPINASSTWRALYVCLNKFHNELVEQISLENNILFRKVRII